MFTYFEDIQNEKAFMLMPAETKRELLRANNMDGEHKDAALEIKTAERKLAELIEKAIKEKNLTQLAELTEDVNTDELRLPRIEGLFSHIRYENALTLCLETGFKEGAKFLLEKRNADPAYSYDLDVNVHSAEIRTSTNEGLRRSQDKLRELLKLEDDKSYVTTRANMRPMPSMFLAVENSQSDAGRETLRMMLDFTAAKKRGNLARLSYYNRLLVETVVKNPDTLGMLKNSGVSFYGEFEYRHKFNTHDGQASDHGESGTIKDILENRLKFAREREEMATAALEDAHAAIAQAGECLKVMGLQEPEESKFTSKESKRRGARIKLVSKDETLPR